MKNINIQGERSLPYVNFNAETGILIIKGRSVSDSGLDIEFYEPLIKWLDIYSVTPALNTTLNIHLDFFSTGTSRCLLNIFQLLEKIHLAGNNTTINWLYDLDDEDMQEAGADYKTILKVPFNLIEME